MTTYQPAKADRRSAEIQEGPAWPKVGLPGRGGRLAVAFETDTVPEPEAFVGRRVVVTPVESALWGSFRAAIDSKNHLVLTLLEGDEFQLRRTLPTGAALVLGWQTDGEWQQARSFVCSWGAAPIVAITPPGAFVGSDRRRVARVAAALDVIVGWADRGDVPTTTGRLCDLGLGGLSALVPALPPIGADCGVVFWLEPDLPIGVVARNLSELDASAQQQRLRVKFMQVNRRDRERLAAYVLERLAEPARVEA